MDEPDGLTQAGQRRWAHQALARLRAEAGAHPARGGRPGELGILAQLGYRLSRVRHRDAARIEGIGRPRTEPAFLPAVIDLAMPVPDGASVAAKHQLAAATGWSVGPSTGSNFWGALRIAHRMRQRGESGSIATLIGDGADAYRRTYYDSDWLRGRQLDPDPYAGTISRFLAGDGWSEPS